MISYRVRFVIAHSCGPVSVSGCGVQEICVKGRIRRLGYLRLAPSGLAFSLVVYFSVGILALRTVERAGHLGTESVQFETQKSEMTVIVTVRSTPS